MNSDPLLLMEEALKSLEAEQTRRSPKVQREYDFMIIALRSAVAYYRTWVINPDFLVQPNVDIPDEYRLD